MRLQDIERVTPNEMSSPNAQGERFDRPFILTGGAADWPAMHRLQFEEIRRAFGSIRVPVRTTDDEFKVFFNVGSQAAGPRRMQSLAEYVSAIERYDGTGQRPPYAGNISILKDPAVSQKLGSLVADCRFPDVRLPYHAMEYRLWIAARGQRSTIHNDPYHNLNAQIAGTKRFLIFAPEQHPSLYPVFFHREMWASPIDPCAPDLARYPDFRDVEGFEGELQPGDILFLPRFWWHLVESTAPCVNVNQWMYLDSELQWWHEQPEARRFIAFRELLDQQCRYYESLSPEMQEYRAADFAKLKTELLRFVECPA